MKFLGLLFILSNAAYVQMSDSIETTVPNDSLAQYLQETSPLPEKSMIYVFYDGQKCADCSYLVSQIQQIYDHYYKEKYLLHILDYKKNKDYNFIKNYNLYQNFGIVLVKVNNNNFLSYKVIKNLSTESRSFSIDLRFKIDSFLGENS